MKFGRERILAKVEFALFGNSRKIGMAEAHRVVLGVGHQNSLAVIVVFDHIADLEEERHTAVVGIDLGAVVLHRATVEGEGIHVAVDWGYGEQVRTIAVEGEDSHAAVDSDCREGFHTTAAAAEEDDNLGEMDCVEEVRMVVALEGSRDCIPPVAVDSLVADSLEEGIDSVVAADILLLYNESKVRWKGGKSHAYVGEGHHIAAGSRLAEDKT